MIILFKNVSIKLIAETFAADSIGNQTATETNKTVYAEIASVSQSEFFQAGQSGLKPDYKVIMWSFEYNGENIIEYDSKRYNVYRTFLRTDEKIELYLTQKAGV